MKTGQEMAREVQALGERWDELTKNNAFGYVNALETLLLSFQADALDAAAEAAREFLTGMTSKEVTRAIVELIPTAPGTPPPGEPSSSPGHRKSGT